MSASSKSGCSIHTLKLFPKLQKTENKRTASGGPLTQRLKCLILLSCLEAEVHDDVDVIPGDINANGSADIARVVHDFAMAFA